VGPALAQAIVEYRTRHGRFRRVDDLLDVPGIGPAKLAVLRPLVKV
jgi:competence protein ComEA